MFDIIYRYIALFVCAILLTGCLGGTVAQQIVRSIATSMADKAMARAMDVDEDQPYSNRKSSNTSTQTANAPATQSSSLPRPYQAAKSPANAKQDVAKRNAEQYQLAQLNIQQAQNDPYRIAIANTAFEELKPIAEPLPTEVAEAESTSEIILSSQLVRVELFNLLIGDEKNAVYEQARLMGSTSLPQKREWALWRVATGAIQANQNQASQPQPGQKMITFLIPPEFGKLPSGAVTMVELASPGELNVARYKAN